MCHTKTSHAILVPLFLLAFTAANGVDAQTCLYPDDFYAGPALGLTTVNMPPARILHAIIPGSPPTPSLLEVRDCNADGNLDAFIPWSDVGIPQPATIQFQNVCGATPPLHVRVIFHQSVQEVTWAAFSTTGGTPVSIQTTLGNGPHVVDFNHANGIKSVQIGGAEIAIFAICHGCEEDIPVEDPHFKRGDVNINGSIDLSDAISILSYLFRDTGRPPCLDAADANDDGAIDLADVIKLLSYLFQNDAPPPGGGICNPDRTPDRLDCQNPGPCRQPGGPSVVEESRIFDVPPQPVPENVLLPKTPTQLHLTLRSRGIVVSEADNSGLVSIMEAPDPENPCPLSRKGAPGDPDITRRIVNVLLPFDADPTTLSIRINDQQTGLYSRESMMLQPVGCDTFYDEESETVQTVAPKKVVLDDMGRNVNIYATDRLWPPHPLQVAGLSRLRAFKYVRLLFSPAQWNPVSGHVVVTDEMHITLSWERAPINEQAMKLQLSDPALHDIFTEGNDEGCQFAYFENWLEHMEWYMLTLGFEREGSYDYVIVTTRDIRSNSTELDDFVAHKESQGNTVAVVSVEAIAYKYPAGERADSIRAFLMDKYAEWSITWLLLIGDPDPYDQYQGASDSVGSVPMKMAWPRGDGLIGTTDSGSPDYGYCPTDHYYADLSGEWDVDGDGYAASNDDITMLALDLGLVTIYLPVFGFDFDMELKVGRIPFDDIGMIDTVLARTIRYQENSDNPSSGRSRVYSACSFLTSTCDYAHLGRQLHDEIFDPFGLTTVTFYQPASDFASTHALEDTALIDAWTDRSAGLVLWAGHGNSVRTRIGYDDNWTGYIMRDSDAPNLTKGPSPFMFQASCSNARPEDDDNLAHTMLYETAISTVAGTRSSYFSAGDLEFGQSDNIGDLAYRYMKWLVKGNSAGYALQRLRADCSPDRETRRQNLMTYNLYGDPKGTYRY